MNFYVDLVVEDPQSYFDFEIVNFLVIHFEILLVNYLKLDLGFQLVKVNFLTFLFLFYFFILIDFQGKEYGCDFTFFRGLEFDPELDFLLTFAAFDCCCCGCDGGCNKGSN